MSELTRKHAITDAATLAVLYGEPDERSIVKEIDHLHPHYRAFLEASPFCILATRGPDGLDASPRGDQPGFVAVEDDKTLLIPDRRGNNRADSLYNILHDPHVALLFLIPGVGETLRVNGRAETTIDPELLERFAVGGKRPRSVLVVRIDSVFFQCSRAVVRADLWNPEKRIDRRALPSTGTILAALSAGRFGGDAYDREQPERVRATLY